ncbi:putative DnaJ [Gregarina niphandrodes]|uniref:DnaJ n=1 Tax=Gregarina niphandrodes TaxID=110365 RepID=A0A023AYV5_GRENI|nr:putative DnaJ [Gregarina niphandrodes]EZG43455.1 putative DnaJ [Gregarina niphandrodes]|eukprot:XP_011133306.1 putative DnaJ [Gregarina niphandrodes]
MEEQLTKRQQKLLTKLSKAEESSGRRPYTPPDKEKPVNKLALLKHLVIVLLVAAGLLWLKSGESWYDELVSTTTNLDFDPYKVLDVPRNAPASTIKKRYRELSLIWHPDRRESCDEECHVFFDRITEAHKILSSPQKRQLYDTTAKVLEKTGSMFTSDMHPFEYVYSPEVWDNIVKPSVEGKQLGMVNHISGVWVVFVAPPSSLTSHILPIWSDLAAKYYGRISFLRIDASDPSYESRMPFRIRMQPAFFMLSPVDAPLFYSDLSKFSPASFVEWVNTNMPSPFTRWQGTDEALAEYLLNGRNEENKIPVAVISNKLPGTVLKAAAIKTESTLEWIQPPSSRFMDYMGENVQQNVARIKEGAALVTRLNDTGYVKIIASKAYKLDGASYGAITKENMDETTAGKYLKLMTGLSKRIIAGNAVTGYRENYRYLCGSADKTTYCYVKKNQHKFEPQFSLLQKELAAKNETIQRVYLPPKHRASQMSGLLDGVSGCSGVLLQLQQEKIACVQEDGTIGEWQDTGDTSRYFPRLRKTNWEIACRWALTHPLMSAMIVSFPVMTYQLIMYFINRKRANNKANIMHGDSHGAQPLIPPVGLPDLGQPDRSWRPSPVHITDVHDTDVNTLNFSHSLRDSEDAKTSPVPSDIETETVITEASVSIHQATAGSVGILSHGYITHERTSTKPHPPPSATELLITEPATGFVGQIPSTTEISSTEASSTEPLSTETARTETALTETALGETSTSALADEQTHSTASLSGEDRLERAYNSSVPYYGGELPSAYFDGQTSSTSTTTSPPRVYAPLMMYNLDDMLQKPAPPLSPYVRKPQETVIYCYPFADGEIMTKCKQGVETMEATGVYIPMMNEVQTKKSERYYEYIERVRAHRLPGGRNPTVYGVAYDNPNWELIIDILNSHAKLFDGIMLEWVGAKACIWNINKPARQQIDTILEKAGPISYFFRQQDCDQYLLKRAGTNGAFFNPNSEVDVMDLNVTKGKFPVFLKPVFPCFQGEEGPCYQAFRDYPEESCSDRQKYSFSPFEPLGGLMMYLRNETCHGLNDHDLYSVI